MGDGLLRRRLQLHRTVAPTASGASCRLARRPAFCRGEQQKRCEVLATLADLPFREIVDVDRAQRPLMKRLLNFLVSFCLALAVCGRLLMSMAQVGAGGIGSVSFGFSEALVEMLAAVILVLAILAGRTLLIRFRNTNTARKS
jgi:hypothetical protein